MNNEISNKYIENAINELESLIGIKEPISGENIFSLLRSDKVKDAITLIARQLDLPIDINITYVPNDYRSQNGVNQFQSTHLVKVSQDGSQGSEGIIAQVIIPSNLPFYGTSALNGYPINVKISENCTEQPVVFSMIMAHELSHVLLYSLMYPNKDNEFYTDLTAIMLGFQNIFQNGRKITTREEIPTILWATKIRATTASYGYLSDEQFDFARYKINLCLKNNEERKKLLFDEIKKSKTIFAKYSRVFAKFEKYRELVSKNHNRNISRDDGKKIVTFFQPGFIEGLSSPMKQYEQGIKAIEIFYKNISHYTDKNMRQLSSYIQELQNKKEEFGNKLSILNRDVKTLRKYVSLLYRIKCLKQNLN